METNCFPSLTFSKLGALEEEELKNVKPELVQKICLLELNNGSEEIKIFKFVLNKYIKTLDIDNWECLFGYLFPEINKYTENLLVILNDQLESHQTDLSILKNFEIILELLMNLQNITISNVGKYHRFLLKSLIKSSLEIIGKLYAYIVKSRKITRVDNSDNGYLRRIQVLCETLQSSIINSIVKKESIFFYAINCDNEVQLFVELLKCLCIIADAVIDLKPTAEILKCITKVCTDHFEILRSNCSESFDTICWLNILVKAVTTKILNLVHNMLYDSQVERNLKISSFYIQVLIKMFKLYGVQYFRGHEYIVKSLLELHKIEENSVNKKIINKNITDEFIKFFNDLSKSENFFNVLLKLKSIYEPDDLLQIYLILLKNVLQENNLSLYSQYFSHEKVNILHIIFECIPNCNISKMCYRYRELRSHLILFVLMSISNELSKRTIENCLLQLTLQCDNYLLGCLLLDIWRSVLRKSTSDTCYCYFNFFAEKNHSSVMHFQVTVINRMLLQNIYDLFTSSDKIKIYAEKFPENNVNLWTVLGNERFVNEDKKNEINNKMITKSNNKINQFLLDNDRSVKDYYDIINHLNFCSKIKTNSNSKLQSNSLIELWKFLNNSKNSNTISPLIISLMRATKANKNLLCNGELVTILKYILHIAITKIPIIKINILIFLNDLSSIYFPFDFQDEILTIFCQLFEIFVCDNDIIIKELSLFILSNVLHVTKHEKILTSKIKSNKELNFIIVKYLKDFSSETEKNCVEILNTKSKSFFLHICTKRVSTLKTLCNTETEPSLKKIKLESMLNTMVEDSNNLRQHFNEFNLDTNSLYIIQKIVKNLNSIK